ncbi:hypothetical protein EIL87_14830 [Saccharopolyspora rhizosphaerae]|uniref:Alpha/beta hydrolase n=1 Tax=Saccharopolyspora rhizosphaerae TaxID=2492662 RepID=A0A3R8QNK1_9PSEU|nr:hypothetical protein [Saccharopolyspora rhizosphaerae]RRO16304.1 hypothetical protein EIL87_14830 [Saccharopolyspora rhizosphaerae]
MTVVARHQPEPRDRTTQQGRRPRRRGRDHDRLYPPSALTGPVRDGCGQEVTVCPDSGHLLVEEHPEALAERLATWVSGWRR